MRCLRPALIATAMFGVGVGSMWLALGRTQPSIAVPEQVEAVGFRAVVTRARQCVRVDASWVMVEGHQFVVVEVLHGELAVKRVALHPFSEVAHLGRLDDGEVCTLWLTPSAGTREQLRRVAGDRMDALTVAGGELQVSTRR